MRQKLSDVRLLLLGDDGVGKTTLILTLISEEFPESVPDRCEDLTIPADVTPEKVATHIIDFSVSGQSEEELFDEVQRANVICIVYSVIDEVSMERVSSHWLPIVYQVLGEGHGTPLILVGNKCDSPDLSSIDQILPIMNQYPEIETCVECSAKKLKNVSELFYYAQKAVLHPTAPLYIAEEKELTQACKKALTRIFKICDHDNDGLLNDYELNDFQVRCFGIPLTSESLRDVKAVVKKTASAGIRDDSFTLSGFLHLHKLFVQRGKHETTWTVLRNFGYDNALNLCTEYLFPKLNVPPGCSVELNPNGIMFLTALFQKYDEDKDGCLSPVEVQNLFSVCPSLTWPPETCRTVQTNEKDWVTYQGFLSYWMLTTLLDYNQMFEYLAYFGYNDSVHNQTAAVTVTRDKRTDWQKKFTERNVFWCQVIGSKDAGKTSLLQGFIGNDVQVLTAVEKAALPRFTVNSLNVCGQEKYLVMHEIDVLTPEETLCTYELQCDVVCLVYDVSNPHSFEYFATIYKNYFHRTRIPCLVVGTKSDCREVPQQFDCQPFEFCKKNHLPPPVKYSASMMRSSDVFVKIATLANYP